jgi:hypothetical protein
MFETYGWWFYYHTNGMVMLRAFDYCTIDVSLQYTHDGFFIFPRSASSTKDLRLTLSMGGKFRLQLIFTPRVKVG